MGIFILPAKFLPKVERNGRHFTVDSALIIVEAALAERFDLGVLVVASLPKKGWRAGHHLFS